MAIKELAWKKLKNDIAEGTVGRFYLLHGEERYLLNFYKNELIKALVDDSMQEFNLIEFTEKVNANDLAEAIDAYPVMSESKLVIITDFDVF